MVRDHPLYIAYHDDEWGAPLHDDRRLFEFLILEGAQAGLSWLTILKKRENYRKAFHGFNCERIDKYTEADIGAPPRFRQPLAASLRRSPPMGGFVFADRYQLVDGCPTE